MVVITIFILIYLHYISSTYILHYLFYKNINKLKIFYNTVIKVIFELYTTSNNSL